MMKMFTAIIAIMSDVIIAVILQWTLKGVQHHSTCVPLVNTMSSVVKKKYPIADVYLFMQSVL